MRIVLTYNLRTEDDETQAERFSQEYVDLVSGALKRLGHDVVHVEASCPTEDVVDAVTEARPDLVFNLAEGTEGAQREALLPTVFEFLNIPYTGGGPELLTIGLDKHLTEHLLEMRGVRVPKGVVIHAPDDPLRDDMQPPLIVKPNYEGSSMGIHEDSIYNDKEAARQRAVEMLSEYPEGMEVEEFIDGREITVPMLSAYPDRLLAPLEYVIDDSEHNIMTYETKADPHVKDKVRTICPAELSEETHDAVMALAARAFSALRTPDLGRADIRLRRDGQPFLIEVNPMPGLREVSPVVASARAMGIPYEDVIAMIISSAQKRYGLEGVGGYPDAEMEAEREALH